VKCIIIIFVISLFSSNAFSSEIRQFAKDQCRSLSGEEYRKCVVDKYRDMNRLPIDDLLDKFYGNAYRFKVNFSSTLTQNRFNPLGGQCQTMEIDDIYSFNICFSKYDPQKHSNIGDNIVSDGLCLYGKHSGDGVFTMCKFNPNVPSIINSEKLKENTHEI